MKNIVIATMIAAAGFATLGTQAANAGGGYKNSYAHQYCHYYKARALGAQNPYRKDRMWAMYYACLKEYGG